MGRTYYHNGDYAYDAGAPASMSLASYLLPSLYSFRKDEVTLKDDSRGEIAHHQKVVFLLLPFGYFCLESLFSK